MLNAEGISKEGKVSEALNITHPTPKQRRPLALNLV